MLTPSLRDIKMATTSRTKYIDCERIYLERTLPSNLIYKPHQIQIFKCFCLVLQLSLPNPLNSGINSIGNEDVVGAAPAGDAPTTSEWSSILLPSRVRLILENLRNFLWCIDFAQNMMTSRHGNASRITGSLWGESTSQGWISLTGSQ